MLTRTAEYLASFRAALIDLQDADLALVVKAVVCVLGQRAWLGLTATTPPEQLRSVIGHAPAQHFMRLGRPSVAHIFGAPETFHGDHGQCFLQLADLLSPQRRAASLDGLLARVEAHRVELLAIVAQKAELERESRERRALEEARRQERLRQAEEAERIHAEREAREKEQRAEALPRLMAGEQLRTFGGHLLAFRAEDRQFVCADCAQTWRRLPQWTTACGGPPAPPEPHVWKPTYCYRTTLTTRYGLNNRWIARLGAPDMVVDSKYDRYGTCSLYALDRVERFIEAHRAEYDAYVVVRAKRSAAAKKAAPQALKTRRATLERQRQEAIAELAAEAAAEAIVVRWLPGWDALEQIARNYYDGPIGYGAIVALVRHRYTNYEYLLDRYAATPDIYADIRRRADDAVASAIGRTYELV